MQTSSPDQSLQQFVGYVKAPSFPCVGALSALNRKRMRFAQVGELGSAESASQLLPRLYEFLGEFSDPGSDPVTFIALFDSQSADEIEFEQRLWRQLGALHELDKQQFEWDASVSRDPGDAHFSFSLGGRGMFVVGLHPHASRLARRSPQDTLVFNLHAQFEELRANGKYESMQRAIRKRDIALQGSINPVLSRFGEASEALQYSGRAAPSKCPFHFDKKN